MGEENEDDDDIDDFFLKDEEIKSHIRKKTTQMATENSEKNIKNSY